jgi:hypothetical protein
MADATVNESSVRRHPNAGRKQSPEHIAMRVAALAATRAKWSEEKREQVRQNFRAAQLKSSSSEETRHRRSVSHRRVSDVETTIYGLYDPFTKQLRYIGKTTATQERRWAIHNNLAKRKTPRRIYNWWRSVLAGGGEPEIFEIEIVQPGGDWVDAEQFWISYFRSIGCDLVNSCDGGQGTSGIKFSDEHIARLRTSHLGHVVSEEGRRKRSEVSLAAWKRNPKSRWAEGQLERMLTTKAARRAAGLYKKRRPATEETKAKISAGKRGKPLTEEHRAKLSAIRKGKQIGKVMSAESRAKMSASHKGVGLSVAHREAITVAQRKRRETKTPNQ